MRPPWYSCSIPIVGELDERRPGLAGPLQIVRGGEEDEGVAALLVLDRGGFRQARACCSRSRATGRGRPPGPSCADIPCPVSFMANGPTSAKWRRLKRGRVRDCGDEPDGADAVRRRPGAAQGAGGDLVDRRERWRSPSARVRPASPRGSLALISDAAHSLLDVAADHRHLARRPRRAQARRRGASLRPRQVRVARGADRDRVPVRALRRGRVRGRAAPAGPARPTWCSSWAAVGVLWRRDRASIPGAGGR